MVRPCPVPGVEAQLEPAAEVELLVDVVEMDLTVPSAMESFPAISLLWRPEEARRTISISLGVSAEGNSPRRLLPREVLERRSRRGLLQPLAAHLHFANALDQKPGRHLFRTMPRTPRRIASSNSSSESVAASRTTRVAIALAFISRSTAKPSWTGIPMSSTRTSG